MRRVGVGSRSLCVCVCGAPKTVMPRCGFAPLPAVPPIMLILIFLRLLPRLTLHLGRQQPRGRHRSSSCGATDAAPSGGRGAATAGRRQLRHLHRGSHAGRRRPAVHHAAPRTHRDTECVTQPRVGQTACVVAATRARARHTTLTRRRLLLLLLLLLLAVPPKPAAAVICQEFKPECTKTVTGAHGGLVPASACRSLPCCGGPHCFRPPTASNTLYPTTSPKQTHPRAQQSTR
jgi:hypothetical protein